MLDKAPLRRPQLCLSNIDNFTSYLVRDFVDHPVHGNYCTRLPFQHFPSSPIIFSAGIQKFMGLNQVVKR